MSKERILAQYNNIEPGIKHQIKAYILIFTTLFGIYGWTSHKLQEKTSPEVQTIQTTPREEKDMAKFLADVFSPAKP